MKRIFPVIATFLVAVILISDIGLVAKYYQNQNAYSAMENVSFVHYLMLHEFGIELAFAKMTFSMAMIFVWFAMVIYPSEAIILRYMTVTYALIWTVIGLLVMTGIVGILQYSASLPIRLYDFSPLVASMGFANLMKLTFGVIVLPLSLVAIPALHNVVLKYR